MSGIFKYWPRWKQLFLLHTVSAYYTISSIFLRLDNRILNIFVWFSPHLVCSILLDSTDQKFSYLTSHSLSLFIRKSFILRSLANKISSNFRTTNSELHSFIIRLEYRMTIVFPSPTSGSYWCTSFQKRKRRGSMRTAQDCRVDIFVPDNLSLTFSTWYFVNNTTGTREHKGIHRSTQRLTRKSIPRVWLVLNKIWMEHMHEGQA